MYPREFFDSYWRPGILDQVFVAMSFKPQFKPVWENIIRPAIDQGATGVKLKAVVVNNSHISKLESAML